MKTTATRNEQGAGMVEMALTVALIAIVCVAAVQEVGKHVSDKYQSVAESVSACGGGGDGSGSCGTEGGEVDPIPE